MNQTSRSGLNLRRWVYAALGVAAVVITWKYNLDWWSQRTAANPLPWTAFGLAFTVDAFRGAPLTASLGWDVLFCGLVAVAWVAHESRRLGMHRLWWLVVFAVSTFVAVSAAIPLFLFVREGRLAALERGSP